ncbi:MAG: porin [Zoogloea sp.]|nr:porin [Zoogloea sp.]
MPLLVAATCGMAASGAQAGATLSFGDDKSVSVGLGMRSSFTSEEKGAPDGSSRSKDFNLDSVRLYINASMSKTIKATFNTERDSDGNIKLLDGYAQFEPMAEFNVWAGRMLPPSDRANLDGPYYLNAWAYPGVVSQYPAIFAGRDDGVLAWGKVMDKKVVYSVGIFQGRNRTPVATTSNQGDNLLYAGRVAFNFWDPEPAPAYYTGSTYYGAADILTVGLAGQYQKDGVGSIATRDAYSAWNADLLMEKRLPAGVATLEGAYYKYAFDQAAATADVNGGVTAGKAYLAGGAFLFPTKVGWGQFQPYVRYQKFKADVTSNETKQSDVGVNYIIDGANAKLSATYSKAESTGTDSRNAVILGLQLQF